MSRQCGALFGAFRRLQETPASSMLWKKNCIRLKSVRSLTSKTVKCAEHTVQFLKLWAIAAAPTSLPQCGVWAACFESQQSESSKHPAALSHCSSALAGTLLCLELNAENSNTDNEHQGWSMSSGAVDHINRQWRTITSCCFVLFGCE